MNRRNFLAAGIVAGAAVASARGAPLLLKPGSSEIVVVDLDMPESLAFGRHGASRGARQWAINSDVTPLWHRLGDEWRQNRTVVMGVTAPGVLFCLERLALDHGLRTYFYGEHDERQAKHQIFFPPKMRPIATVLSDLPLDWCGPLASFMSNCRPGKIPGGFARLSPRGSGLTSWIIGPRHDS